MGSHDVALAVLSLSLGSPPASVSWTLGLQVCFHTQWGILLILEFFSFTPSPASPPPSSLLLPFLLFSLSSVLLPLCPLLLFLFLQSPFPFSSFHSLFSFSLSSSLLFLFSPSFPAPHFLLFAPHTSLCLPLFSNPFLLSFFFPLFCTSFFFSSLPRSFFFSPLFLFTPSLYPVLVSFPFSPLFFYAPPSLVIISAKVILYF